MQMDHELPSPEESSRAPANELRSLLAQPYEGSDAAFSERLWNTAIRLYLQAHAERPALN